MTRILDLDHTDARQFFLKEENYFNFDLPTYFVFENLLNIVSNHIGGQELSTLYSTYTNGKGQTKKHFPAEFEDVNYKQLLIVHISSRYTDEDIKEVSASLEGRAVIAYDYFELPIPRNVK